ncbi:MAG: transcription-repair coupling factor, partial [Gammaproteobacteria bacterium]
MFATLVNAPLALPTEPGTSIRLGKSYGAATALTVAELARLASDAGRSMLVLTGSVAEAESLAGETGFFGGPSSPVTSFPDLETLPYDAFSPHQDLLSSRLRILRDLPLGRCRRLVAAAPSLLPRLPPRSCIAERGIELRAGQQL